MVMEGILSSADSKVKDDFQKSCVKPYMEIIKHCTSCRQPKPLSEFRKQKNTKDGLQYECKTCTDNRARARYDTKRDSIKNKNTFWQVVNYGKHNDAAK